MIGDMDNNQRIYYLDNIFQGNEHDIDRLYDVIFIFNNGSDKLYFEYGYTWERPFPMESGETIIGPGNRIWFRPRDKDEAKLILNNDFMLNCIILQEDRNIDSIKYKLRVIEEYESIKLKIVEYKHGEFEKSLDENKMQLYISNGIKVNM